MTTQQRFLFKALAMPQPITSLLRPEEKLIIGVISHVLNQKDTKVTLFNNILSAYIIKYDFQDMFLFNSPINLLSSQY